MNSIFLQHNLYWIIPIAILEIVLKLIALWHAARNGQLYWYLALAIFNTAGILPAVYLFFFKEGRKKL